MTNLFRRNYRADELDQPVGRVPEFGNPGAVEPSFYMPPPRFTCPIHDVKWAEGGCWMCTEVPC